MPLNASDLPFFASVLAEFTRSDWTAHQLELAALLARSMHDFEREQTLMREEGGVIFTEKGQITNPRKPVVQMHAANVLAMRRLLALHCMPGGKVAMRETSRSAGIWRRRSRRATRSMTTI